MISPGSCHNFSSNQHASVLIKEERVLTPKVNQRNIATRNIQGPWWRYQTSRPVCYVKLVCQQNTRLDLVEDFYVMNQFSAALNVKQTGNYVRVKKVFYSEIALEGLVVEKVKVFLYDLCVTRLGKWEVFVVSELTEVFGNYVFEVVYDGCDWLDFVRIYLLGSYGCFVNWWFCLVWDSCICGATFFRSLELLFLFLSEQFLFLNNVEFTFQLSFKWIR